MDKHKDLCKRCAALELEKKLSELRIKATAQGLKHKPKKKLVKNQAKGQINIFFLISIKIFKLE